MKIVPVAVAMFVRDMGNGCFETWVQQRTEGPLKGMWEFPGGKIEAGESPWDALVREIFEETRVNITGQGRALGIFPFDYPDKRVLLHIFSVPWENDLAQASGKVVPLKLGENGASWQIPLLPANFRLVEYLCRSLYDGRK